ncbi:MULTISPECIES: hypothetical protein [Nocardiopsis]|uniref:Uncharacterized protein n=1 Tax=Nocardiopsis sinuspersici TaxID=501010 RepID=A0A7Y9XBL5_9ACTN|nr:MULTISPECIES: hypothetical protein [Nocardiopsis]NYH52779.1 hypothetical protein [Nocardiopsis sinuspersici]
MQLGTSVGVRPVFDPHMPAELPGALRSAVLRDGVVTIRPTGRGSS